MWSRKKAELPAKMFSYYEHPCGILNMIKFFPAGNGKDGDLMRLFQAISEVKQELDIFLNYESFEKAIDTNKWDHADLLKIQYKILFRQWKLIDEKELDNNIEKKALRPQYNDNGKISWIETGISIRQLEDQCGILQ